MDGPENRHELLCALVVTYHPSPAQVEMLFALANQFDELIVVDNTPEDTATAGKPAALTVPPTALLIRNRANLGLAAALNIGIHAAMQAGHQWIVTLDQDSRITPELLAFFRSILRGDLPVKNLAVMGANYRNTNNGRLGYTADGNTGAFAQVRCVITSGSLLNLVCYKDIGGFNENYFIDMVDTEFCYRARQRGYTVAISTRPMMEHAIGAVHVIRLLGWQVSLTLHPAFRQYYIFRNTLYTVRQYLRFDPWGCLAMLGLYLPKVGLKSLLFGQEKAASLRRIAQGIRDGLVCDLQKKREE